MGREDDASPKPGRRQFLFDLGQMTVRPHLVRPKVLVDLGKEKARLGTASGAGRPGLRVDHDRTVGEDARPNQGNEAE